MFDKNAQEKRLAAYFLCQDFSNFDSEISESMLDFYRKIAREFSQLILFYKHSVVINNDISWNYVALYDLNLEDRKNYQNFFWEFKKQIAVFSSDDFFRYLYLLLFKKSSGPRMGEFIKIFGEREFEDLLQKRLDNPFN